MLGAVRVTELKERRVFTRSAPEGTFSYSRAQVAKNFAEVPEAGVDMITTVILSLRPEERKRPRDDHSAVQGIFQN